MYPREDPRAGDGWKENQRGRETPDRRVGGSTQGGEGSVDQAARRMRTDGAGMHDVPDRDPGIEEDAGSGRPLLGENQPGVRWRGISLGVFYFYLFIHSSTKIFELYQSMFEFIFSDLGAGYT